MHIAGIFLNSGKLQEAAFFKFSAEGNVTLWLEAKLCP
jgi:hypothetical protein